MQKSKTRFDTYLNFITSKLIMDQFSMEITVPLVGSDKVTHPTGIKILLFHFYLSFPFSPLSLAGSGLDVVARLVVGSVVENGPHDRERARHPHNFSFSPFFATQCHSDRHRPITEIPNSTRENRPVYRNRNNRKFFVTSRV